MKEFIEALESNSFNQALEILKTSPSLFEQKSEDGWSVLQLASYYNAPSIINHALSHLDYQQINSDKIHPLLIAFEEKNNDAINAFLNNQNSDKINWSIKEKNGDNLLHLAVYHNFNDVALKLIEKNISCFENNNQGINAFTVVVEKGNLELFDKLDQHQNLVENYDETLIKKSIQFGHIDIFKRLMPYTQLSPDELFKLSYGFENVKAMFEILDTGDLIPGQQQITQIVDLMCRKYENTEEKVAARGLANYLFEIKIPFNKFTNQEGQSAWMLCIQNDNEEVFERLLQSSENVNVSDKDEHTPLFYAIEKNNARFVKALLKKKANPNQVDKHKNSPLIKAVEKGNIEMVRDILQYCQMINETNNQNEHALSIAIKKRRMDIVSELIWAGGEITTNPAKFLEEKHIFHFDFQGQPDRFSYHEEQHVDNFVALSKLGFRLDQINNDGDTFLLHFIKNGYAANFVALLKCQFNPNQSDSLGNSALMCAAQKNHDLYFNSLLNRFRNIDIEHTNSQGENVYDICLKHSKYQRMEQLLNYDDNLTIHNAQKAMRLIAKEGKIENHLSTFKKVGINLEEFVDDNKNNLLMLSVAGANLDNFRFLLENNSFANTLKNENRNGKSLQDLIDALPQEIATDFNLYLKKYIKSYKNP